MSFHEQQNRWEHRLCSICHELWPTRTCLSDSPSTFTWTRCKRDKNAVKLFSAANDMDPGAVPPCLQQLSQIEEMLIARACPIMCVYHKHGGQRGYKGHVLNMPQDIQGFLDRLQCQVSEFSVLSARKHSRSSLTLATPYTHASSLATTVTAYRIYDERGWKSKCHGQPFSHDVMGHYYYGIIIHTCAVTSNNISLYALLLSEALLHLMYALVYIYSVSCKGS